MAIKPKTMKTQEFVKKDSEDVSALYRPSYASGLTKGLEIAESIVWDILSQFGDPSDPKVVIEHYLTEKYGK